MTISNKTGRGTGRKITALTTVAMFTVLSACNFIGFGGSTGGPSQQDAGPKIEGPVVDLNQPVRIAVLLPNKGSNANLNSIGNSIENAAKIAYERQNRGEVDIAYYHTGGDPARAAQLAQQATAEGAKLIIGPLKSEEAAAVDSVTSVPVLSFSNNSDIAGSEVFTLGTTLENVADRVLNYQKRNGGKSLGVVYSNDIGGQLGQSATAKAANSNNIQVVAQEAYTLSQEDIKASGSRIATNLRNSGANMVMFTDYPAGGLGFVGIALRDNGYTNQNAQYMGLARWDDGGAELSGAGFEGGLYTLPDPVRSAEFDTVYKAKHGDAPHSLAGLGYDGVLSAIKLVREARSNGDNTPFSTDNFRELSFLGATGALRYYNNSAWRGLAVMKLTNGQGVLVSQAPKGM